MLQDPSERRMDDPRPAEPGGPRAQCGALPVATLLSRCGCSRRGCDSAILGGAHSLGLIGECCGAIGALPGELRLGAAEMPVGRGLLVDRADQVQHLAQPVRCEIEVGCATPIA